MLIIQGMFLSLLSHVFIKLKSKIIGFKQLRTGLACLMFPINEARRADSGLF